MGSSPSNVGLRRQPTPPRGRDLPSDPGAGSPPKSRTTPSESPTNLDVGGVHHTSPSRRPGRVCPSTTPAQMDTEICDRRWTTGGAGRSAGGPRVKHFDQHTLNPLRVTLVTLRTCKEHIKTGIVTQVEHAVDVWESPGGVFTTVDHSLVEVRRHSTHSTKMVTVGV